MAKIARIECQLDFGARSYPPAELSQLWSVVFQAFQFDAVVEHHSLSRHAKHEIQLARIRRQRRRQGARIAVPPMGRRVLDTAMGRLQIHVDDPVVQDLAERAQDNYSL